MFDYAAAWCYAGEPLKHARAADILCQLGPSFRDESYTLVTGMLKDEQNPVVLGAAVAALGHLDNPEAIPIILRYLDHADPDLRFAVSAALGCFPNDQRSIQGLLKLTTDRQSNVRDWAVFGLGVQGDADSPSIREALFRCLGDDDDDVREEAAVGLAKRHDPRVIPALRAMLDKPQVTVRAVEAIKAFLGNYFFFASNST